MNTEQIAYEEASGEMLDYFSKEQLAGFLRRCLSKLAEQDVEPVAWQGKSGHLVYDKAALMPSTRHLATPLYTESQLLAAQQRTAEACAKAVERLISGDGLCADDGVWIHDCAEAIRNGDWREYL